MFVGLGTIMGPMWAGSLVSQHLQAMLGVMLTLNAVAAVSRPCHASDAPMALVLSEFYDYYSAADVPLLLQEAQSSSGRAVFLTCAVSCWKFSKFGRTPAFAVMIPCGDIHRDHSKLPSFNKFIVFYWHKVEGAYPKYIFSV